jgi:tetratricopeptide (TPR) repeat protein
LTTTERDFLVACREARAIAERERRQARRIRWWASVATIISIIAIMACFVAYKAYVQAQIAAENARQATARAEQRRVEAEHLRRISLTQALIAQALLQQDQRKQDEQSALLARQAYLVDQPDQRLLIQVNNVLRLALLAPYFSHILHGHEDEVRAVAFSPDGKFLAAGSEDRTVRLWEVRNPQAPPLVLRGHEDEVRAVAFSPDGKFLASGGGRIILIWITDTETLANMVCEKVWRNLTLEEWRQFVGPDLPYELTCSNLPMDPGFIQSGQELARVGNVHDAVALFQRALQLDPRLNLHPQAEAQKWAVLGLVEQGQKLVKQGLAKEALAAYAKAQTLAPAVEISAEAWNELCWEGSLRGYAGDVIRACEQAVAIEPGNGNIRDSRGLARWLTGNPQGAIEDFQVFVDQTQNETQRAQRQRWIERRRAGETPFTSEEIEQLRSP